jgi:hypothetical protein
MVFICTNHLAEPQNDSKSISHNLFLIFYPNKHQVLPREQCTFCLEADFNRTSDESTLALLLPKDSGHLLMQGNELPGGTSFSLYFPF